MRTTIRLDDDLLRDAKIYAARRGITLTRLIEEVLREQLARPESNEPAAPAADPAPDFRSRRGAARGSISTAGPNSWT